MSHKLSFKSPFQFDRLKFSKRFLGNNKLLNKQHRQPSTNKKQSSNHSKHKFLQEFPQLTRLNNNLNQSILQSNQQILQFRKFKSKNKNFLRNKSIIKNCKSWERKTKKKKQKGRNFNSKRSTNTGPSSMKKREREKMRKTKGTKRKWKESRKSKKRKNFYNNRKNSKKRTMNSRKTSKRSKRPKNKSKGKSLSMLSLAFRLLHRWQLVVQLGSVWKTKILQHLGLLRLWH